MAFEALLQYARQRTDAVLGRGDAVASPGFVLGGRAGQVYNEVAFRHFLALERKRAERSNRTFLLLLVNVKDSVGRGRLSAAMATRLFSSLSQCVREVDFVGWYREEQVAGAVLAQGPTSIDGDVKRLIAGRVTDSLREALPARVAERLQVRLLQVRRRTTC